MENNFIFVIVVILVIIIIVAISNRGEEITHHHAKPHFDQPKNVMRIKASKQYINYTVFKLVTNDHSEQTDQDEIETVYKGHEPDNSTTKKVQVGTFVNTQHGTTVEIPLVGNGIDNDAGQLITVGTKNCGTTDSFTTETSNPIIIREYTVMFPPGNYSPSPDNSPPTPNITNVNSTTGPNMFHITVSPGSNIVVGTPKVFDVDKNKVSGNFVISCGILGIGVQPVCKDSSKYADYFACPCPTSFTTGTNVTKYCLINPNTFGDPVVSCSSDSLSTNVSFTLNFPNFPNVTDPFTLIKPVTSIITIDSSPSLGVNPCGPKCPF